MHTFTLTNDETLVLSQLFARIDEKGSATIEHQAEQIAIWSLIAQFETVLVEPFQADFVTLLDAARKRVAAEYS